MGNFGFLRTFGCVDYLEREPQGITMEYMGNTWEIQRKAQCGKFGMVSEDLGLLIVLKGNPKELQ